MEKLEKMWQYPLIGIFLIIILLIANSCGAENTPVEKFQDSFNLDHARPYQVVEKGNLANENPQRTAGLWYITSKESDSFEEYAQTSIQAVLDLSEKYGNIYTGVLLIPHPDVKTVYTQASYSSDGKGASGMTGSAPAVPMYWKVRVMDDLKYNEQELEILKLWQAKQSEFPNPDPWSSQLFDETALRNYIADTLHVTYEETKPRQLKMVEYYVDKPVSSLTASSKEADLASVNKSVWKSFTTDDAVLELVAAGNELWATTSSGVIRWNLENGNRDKFTEQDGLNSSKTRRIIRDSRGNIWVTCYVSGVSRFDGEKWDSFTVKNGLCSDDTISLAADKNGGVWVSAYWGVSYFNGSSWSSYSNIPPDALVAGGDNPMRDCQNLTFIDAELSGVDVIFVDSRNNIWFSSRGRGVTRYDGSEWRMFTSKDGLGEGGINTIFEDTEGLIWFDGYMGMTSFDGTKFTFYPVSAFKSVIPRPVGQDILQDNRGNLWVAYYGGGVIRFDGKDWNSFSVPDGLPGINAQLLFLNKDGYPCVVTDKGVSRFDGNTWQVMTEADGLPEGNIRVVVKDDKENYWFGTERGVIYYNN